MVRDKLGFISVFALHQSIVLRRFFKSDRPRGVSAKTAFSFCKAFSFVPLVAKEKASNKS